MSKKAVVLGLIIVGIFACVALAAPFIAPFDPYTVVAKGYIAPNRIHWLGTNDIGQDIFSELLYGARTSLGIGILSAFLSVGIGVVLGMIGGWYGGAADRLVSKLTAFFLTIPYLPTIIILSAFTKPGMVTTSLVLGLMSWAGIARVVRSQTMVIKKKDYIVSIRAMGATASYVLSVHVWRELLPWLMYQFAIRVKSSILSEAALGFLGLGSTTQKSWGTIIHYAQAKNALLTEAWLWWILPPGICIILLSCGLIMISYGAEEKTDQRIAESALKK